MKYQSTMLVVEDIETAKAFYKEVMGLRVTLDLGVNVTLTGGLALQTRDSWKEFIEKKKEEITYRGNDVELYFEEDDFGQFIQKLESEKDIEYVHPVKEHSWGQRVVRFYDPDGHIIEVGENLKMVCRRFLDSGLTEEQTAKRMGMQVGFVKRCRRE